MYLFLKLNWCYILHIIHFDISLGSWYSKIKESKQFQIRNIYLSIFLKIITLYFLIED